MLTLGEKIGLRMSECLSIFGSAFPDTAVVAVAMDVLQRSIDLHMLVTEVDVIVEMAAVDEV